MASPAVAVAQVNGVSPLSRPDSPASINSTTKRKRESSDDNGADLNRGDPPKLPVNGVHSSQYRKSLVHDFYRVLERYAPRRCRPLRCIDCPTAPGSVRFLPAISVLTSSTLAMTPRAHRFSSALFQIRFPMASQPQSEQSQKMASP